MKNRRYFFVTLLGMSVFWFLSSIVYHLQNGIADWLWFSRVAMATICFIGAGLLTEEKPK